MELSPKVKSEIVRHAEKLYPNEACGLILSRAGELVAFPCRNLHNSPKRFTIDPRDYVIAAGFGNILAVYHSHCSDNKSPSAFDIQSSLFHKLPFITYNVLAGTFCESDGMALASYLGREFEIGISDCFSLVRDFYLRELGILLSDYPRTEGWYKGNPRILVDNFEREGFFITSKITKHCVFLIKSIERLQMPHHLMLYLGDDCVLHHPRKQKSLVEPLTSEICKTIHTIIQHKDVCTI